MRFLNFHVPCLACVFRYIFEVKEGKVSKGKDAKKELSSNATKSHKQGIIARLQVSLFLPETEMNNGITQQKLGVAVLLVFFV